MIGHLFRKEEEEEGKEHCLKFIYTYIRIWNSDMDVYI
jgi:hypothetical protein